MKGKNSIYAYGNEKKNYLFYTRLDETQTGIKITRRNISNLRYEDDTTLMVESKEELKSLLMRVKEDSERAGLRLNIKNNLRSWHPAPLLHSK